LTAPATVLTRRAVDDGGADEQPDARHARVEVRHDDVDGVVITLHGDFGCRDIALLSCPLHTELDASPARMVVDTSRLRGDDDALRLIESAHHTGRDR
jgi:hypothetical protein